MKKIYASANRVVMEMLKSTLLADNIACVLKNEFPPAAGEVTASVAWPELWVLSDDDKTRAQQLVRQALEEMSVKTGEWRCPHCQEQLEDQFVMCWQCGYIREKGNVI